MNNTSKNVRRKQANRPALHKKDFLIGAFAIGAVVIMILIVILGPKILSPAPPQEKKVPSALPEQAEEKPVTPEEYRLGKSYVLKHTTDPKTGDVSTSRVTIDEMLVDGNVALRNRDFASYKKIEDKLISLGDQVVPDLGEIMLYEKNMELLTAAANTLGKIGTDKAISQLAAYLNERKNRPINDNFIAASVVSAIALSENKHAPEVLKDIFLNGRTPAERAEAMKALSKAAKGEQWFQDALVQIANNAQEGDILRASAIRLLADAGDKDALALAMTAYFAMNDIGSKIEIIWALDQSNADGVGEFFAKVCSQERNQEVLMQALPAWYKLHENDDPAARVKFLEAMYNRKIDAQTTKSIVSYLCQIDDGQSLTLLQKIAATDGSRAIRDMAGKGVDYLRQKMAQNEKSGG